MIDSLEVTLETDAPPIPVVARRQPVLNDVTDGSLGNTVARQRFTSGKGCGFVVNVS